ncbi:MAG: uncharacterized protein KVP18_003981, partial [Porospora cf. gigantea A]|uniref:uncharacterized protein n=1 Tax=Porospora cf. gigantea A TaxID=2853593 RepID=UPI00355A33FB
EMEALPVDDFSGFGCPGTEDCDLTTMVPTTIDVLPPINPEERLLLSEYVMGSTTNRRAVEVSNYGSAAAHLENYSLRIFLDGVPQHPQVMVPLEKACEGRSLRMECVLEPGASVTVLDANYDLTRPSGLTTSTDLKFDGVGDAVFLFQRAVSVDRLGSMFDPQDEWGTQVTLRRKPHDVNGNLLPYDNGIERFQAYEVDDVSNLGRPTAENSGSP